MSSTMRYFGINLNGKLDDLGEHDGFDALEEYLEEQEVDYFWLIDEEAGRQFFGILKVLLL